MCTLLYFLLQTSFSGSSGQQQNDTAEDVGAKKRRRREANENQEESSTKVKREAESNKPEKLQSDLVGSQDQNINSPSCSLTLFSSMILFENLMLVKGFIYLLLS